jgi:hypothetical protein
MVQTVSISEGVESERTVVAERAFLMRRLQSSAVGEA